MMKTFLDLQKQQAEADKVNDLKFIIQILRNMGLFLLFFFNSFEFVIQTMPSYLATYIQTH